MPTFQVNVWVLRWLFQSWDLWDVIVGVGLLSCIGRTFQGWGSIPLEEMSNIVRQNLSRLGFDSLIRDEDYCVCEHLNNFLCCQKVCLLFMLIAKLQLSFIIE
jgi:hypothetical protein